MDPFATLYILSVISTISVLCALVYACFVETARWLASESSTQGAKHDNNVVRRSRHKRRSSRRSRQQRLDDLYGSCVSV